MLAEINRFLRERFLFLTGSPDNMATQLQASKTGMITDEVKSIAQAENLSAELVRDEIAAGRLVIPANRLHLKTNLKPIGIGRVLRTKVNANIGTSSVRSSIQAEIEKMKVALAAGADAIMDLSTGGNLDSTREQLLAQCPVPFGTVPIYQVIEG
jgi:phosphomethylpyrimidine synthase